MIKLLHEQHSTAHIANYVGMTASGLHDKFKKHFGITTCAYCKQHGITQIKGF